MGCRTSLLLVPLTIAGCASAASSASGTRVADAQTDAPPEAEAAEAEASGLCEAGAGADVSPDAAACSINLAHYDRSCSVDSDCVSTVELSCAVYSGSRPIPHVYIRGGNFCVGCNCNLGAAVNRNAVAHYITDLSATPEGSGQVAFPICNCPASPPPSPSCINGTCGLSGGTPETEAGE
jgi:hypothetical protein